MFTAETCASMYVQSLGVNVYGLLMLVNVSSGTESDVFTASTRVLHHFLLHAPVVHDCMKIL